MLTTSTVTDTERFTRVVVPDSPADIWVPRFPSPAMVDSAAALLPRLPVWDGREGPRSRIIVAPGVLAVSQRDPARVERAAEQALRRHAAKVRLEASDLLIPDRLSDAREVEEAALNFVNAGLFTWEQFSRAADRVQFLEDHLSALAQEAGITPATITAWSRRSRSRMVKVLAQLDYAPLYDVDDLGYPLSLGYGSRALPAMLTLTYPGEWEAVAPDAKTCKGHVDALKKRFQRRYGRPLLGIWKREFQRRGAPHYHVMMVPPAGFREWVSRTWADIVAADWCGATLTLGCPDLLPCERHAHVRAGTGVDFREGTRATDPRRLAVYFSKHGAFSAKDYQNDAPASWIETGSVGRFWGVWGLDKALAVVEVHRDVADAAARTLRRWSRANGYVVQREVWRANARTGVMRKRRSGVRVYRMPGRLGFVTLNDAPAFTSQLARYLVTLDEGAHIEPARSPRGASGPATTWRGQTWQDRR